MATATWFTPTALFADSGDVLVPSGLKAAATAKVTIQALRRDVSVLLGVGGNIAVLTGPDGELLVDAEIVTARPHASAAFASINADPIRQLINTHWHFDHTGGNEWLHEAGASILAQENTRKHLSEVTRVEGWKHTFPAAPAGAIPSIVFKEDYTLHANGTTLILKHYLPAHTDSDISVHFAEADVFHTGDTVWNGEYPFIDYSTGGSIDGMIHATEVETPCGPAKTRTASAENREHEVAESEKTQPLASSPSIGGIRQRAYELHPERGCIHGWDRDDWLQAERELTRRMVESRQCPRPTT